MSLLRRSYLFGNIEPPFVVEIINKKYNEKMKLKNMSKKNQQ
jgi:hypothetical protein